LGLTEIQKLLLQIAASILFVWVLRNSLSDIEVIIPFTKFTFNMGYWYLPFSVLVIISAVNAVNLTDGLDGLATCITIVVTTFFLLVAYIMEAISVTVFCVALLGSTVAFLLFNKYPAKIFMGDTGSLFLGGALAGISIITGTPLFLIIAGGVFVAEAISVILQVGYFKLTGKRIFKMAPLHHHFEMCGFKEQKIVIIFSLFSLLLCIITFGGFLLSL
jgi:phospho-N-acetylmuramoyl-pentapeptide-transferase